MSANVKVVLGPSESKSPISFAASNLQFKPPFPCSTIISARLKSSREMFAISVFIFSEINSFMLINTTTLQTVFRAVQ